MIYGTALMISLDLGKCTWRACGPANISCLCYLFLVYIIKVFYKTLRFYKTLTQLLSDIHY